VGALKAKWHGQPVWVWLALAIVVGLLAFHLLANKNSTATGAGTPAAGAAGARGASGARGVRGPRGLHGVRGLRGKRGARGRKGVKAK
jgi:hypothetical protein